MEQVILVDDADRPIGVAEKLAAHRDGGQLHRAFSIFVFDAAGRMLLQRRARQKYHFVGLWSNTCCGHPRPGEDVVKAGERRLAEEFGFSAMLECVGHTRYEAHDPATGLTEREYLHLLRGSFDGTPQPNPDEIDAWRWVTRADLSTELQGAPERFTPWFRHIIECVDRVWPD